MRLPACLLNFFAWLICLFGFFLCESDCKKRQRSRNEKTVIEEGKLCLLPQVTMYVKRASFNNSVRQNQQSKFVLTSQQALFNKCLAQQVRLINEAYQRHNFAAYSTESDQEKRMRLVNETYQRHQNLSQQIFASYSTDANQEKQKQQEQQQQVPPPPPSSGKSKLLKWLFMFLVANGTIAYALVKYYELDKLLPRDIFQATDPEDKLYTGKDVHKNRSFGDTYIRFLRAAYTV